MTVLFSFSVIIAAIFLLSVITDRFFVESLDAISHRWKLPPSVAGASLMAVGSSAPELSIAVLSLFKEGGAHSDLGIGTIVGSAVFNILVITGVCAVIREAKIHLPAVIRDTVFYLGSILLLLIVFFDGRITRTDALILLAFYIVYLAFLFLFRMPGEETVPEEISEEKTEEPPEQPAEERRSGAQDAPPDGAADTPFVPSGSAGRIFQSLARAVVPLIDKTAALFGKAAGDPATAYFRGFFVSIAAIIALSWILVDAALLFSDGVGLPPVVVALTVLAAGTSAPDLIASVLVARRGDGGMAVANAVGSNIFDILAGLGLPWIMALSLSGDAAIQVGTGGLLTAVAILVTTVGVLFWFLYTDRSLSRKEGWILLGLYGIYILHTLIAG